MFPNFVGCVASIVCLWQCHEILWNLFYMNRLRTESNFSNLKFGYLGKNEFSSETILAC